MGVSPKISGKMESRIIDSATKVFVRKGYAATSMQDIATEAGINRPSLNYYFRTKDKLFQLVFEKVSQIFIPALMEVIDSKIRIQEKFTRIIDIYFNLLSDNPLFPIFILHEIQVNPELLIKNLQKKGLNPHKFILEIEDAMENGILKKANPNNILVNLISLIFFPFIAKPIFEGLFFDHEQAKTIAFINQRREYIKQYFLESITVRK